MGALTDYRSEESEVVSTFVLYVKRGHFLLFCIMIQMEHSNQAVSRRPSEINKSRFGFRNTMGM